MRCTLPPAFLVTPFIFADATTSPKPIPIVPKPVPPSFCLFPGRYRTLTLVALALSSLGRLQAQRPTWQQQADYEIDVTLDPAGHTLRASGTIVYHNNSPESLDSIPLQLWANAYAHRDSPYAKQVRRYGKTDFAFAPESALGGYRSLTISGAEVARSSSPNPELLWVHLVNPVRSGDSVAIAFSYSLRVPMTFSRMGRDAGAYQITQWYPKVALYDQEGWHPLPYLDFGEFFNDFGNYKVSVTVPSNGIVAATGALVNAEGQTAIEARLLETQTDTLRIDTLKYGTDSVTFVYEARDVTDFAWFVNSRFRIGRAEAKLDDRSIPAYAFYQAAEAAQWHSAAGYIARAAAYADSLIGAYPHPHITAVSAPLGVGGGMEYPMITVIGATATVRELDEVLAHEAFHNWFALSIATNERAHAWMDEGLTSWLEHRYMNRYYGESGGLLAETLPEFLIGESRYAEGSLLQSVLAKAARHPAPDTHSDSLTQLGYGYAAYTQPQHLFDFLEFVIGRSELDRLIAGYYARWEFGHPGPRDLQAALGGEKVAWLFDDLLLDNKVPDYQLQKVTRDGALVSFEIENHGDAASPVILAYQMPDETYVESVTMPGFLGTQSFQLSVPEEAQRVAIDPYLRSPEVNRADNYRKVEGSRGSGLATVFSLAPRLGDPSKRTFGLLPLLTFNEADKLAIGAALHNYTLDVGALRFYVAPQITTRDASPVGVAGLKYSIYKRDSWWREMEYGASVRTYHYDYNDNYDFSERFTRVTATVNLLLASDPGLRTDQRIELTTHLVDQRYARGISVARQEFTKESREYHVEEAAYQLEHRDPITPWKTRVAFETGAEYGRFSGTLDYGVRYQEAANFVRFRLFAGVFAFRQNPQIRAFLLPNGITGFGRDQNDYTFTENLVNRAEPSNQYFVRDGSLTLPFTLTQSGSDTWLTSLSVTVDAPIKLPVFDLRAYGDLAVFPNQRPTQNGVLAPATAGLRIVFPRELASISFPLYNSAFVRESLVFTKVGAKYRERIALRLDLAKVNLDELLREFRG